MNIKQSIQQLANKYEEIYSKIAKVINIKDTTIDVELYENKSMVYDVRLIAGKGGNLTRPQFGSDVIVTFLDRNNAFVSLIANSDYTQIQTSGTVLEKEGSSMNMGITNGKSSIVFNTTKYEIITRNGGTVSMIPVNGDDNYIIHGNKVIKLIVDSDNQVKISNTGIELIISNDPNQKITIGNNVETLKTLLNDLISAMITSTYGTYPLDPVVTIPSLVALQERINALFD